MNSDDETNKKSKLIVLNEQLQPIRPLRPKTSVSSANNSNSNSSSRPISHISDDVASQCLSLLNKHFQIYTIREMLDNMCSMFIDKSLA